ncbi:MAG: hypothetical protein KJZ69_17530 [Phycisphaerales bacterium]|nr:hypothetical protein [Phycisphaerales bacterium]
MRTRLRSTRGYTPSSLGDEDIVLPRLRAVVLIHGCFWHRYSCERGRSEPSTRRVFWRAKFAGNVQRDKRALRALRRAGWRVLVVWECQTRDVDRLRTRLSRFLSAKPKVRPRQGWRSRLEYSRS